MKSVHKPAENMNEISHDDSCVTYRYKALRTSLSHKIVSYSFAYRSDNVHMLLAQIGYVRYI